MHKWWSGRRLWITSHTRILTLLAVLVAVTIFVLFLERSNSSALGHQKQVAETFQPFAVGAGALLSGAAAFNYLEDWLRKQKSKETQARDWRERFPLDQLGTGFKVIQPSSAPGRLYIYDLKGKSQHWIIDPATLRWLNLSYSDVETMADKDFEKLKRGDNIGIDQ